MIFNNHDGVKKSHKCILRKTEPKRRFFHLMTSSECEIVDFHTLKFILRDSGNAKSHFAYIHKATSEKIDLAKNHRNRVDEIFTSKNK